MLTVTSRTGAAIETNAEASDGGADALGGGFGLVSSIEGQRGRHSLAAEPAERSLSRMQALMAAAGGRQHPIARQVAVRVVDLLK